MGCGGSSGGGGSDKYLQANVFAVDNDELAEAGFHCEVTKESDLEESEQTEVEEGDQVVIAAKAYYLVEPDPKDDGDDDFPPFSPVGQSLTRHWKGSKNALYCHLYHVGDLKIRCGKGKPVVGLDKALPGLKKGCEAEVLAHFALSYTQPPKASMPAQAVTLWQLTLKEVTKKGEQSPKGSPKKGGASPRKKGGGFSAEEILKKQEAKNSPRGASPRGGGSPRGGSPRSGSPASSPNTSPR